MDSGEASQSLEQPDQIVQEAEQPITDRTAEQAVTADREVEPESQGSKEEWRQLRQVRGRHRAALTRIFRRAEALLADGATRAQLKNICGDIDSAFEALTDTNRCLEAHLEL